jgi:hypothetical protein
MADLQPIWNITIGDVREVVRRSLQRTLDVDQIEDFVASIDWSGISKKRPPIADCVGELALSTCEFRDGMMSRDQYLAYLLSLLPEDERARYASTARRD